MRTYQGLIISVRDPKTAKVEIRESRKHPLYKKLIFKTKNLLVDTEGLTVTQGDSVLIGEIKPVSKTKHYKVIKVLK